MDRRSDLLSSDSTLLSKQIMNKLIDLKEWQQKQEELLRITQQKQIISLNEQKNKLNALTNNSNQRKEEFVLNSNENCIDFNDNNRKPVEFNDESIEEIRTEENGNKNDLINNNSVENDFTRQSLSQSFLESSPVVPGIDGKNVKTFEDLLNIKLSVDKNVNKDSVNVEKKPKQPFLRKGEGIKRFEGIHKIESKKSLINIEKKDCFGVYETRKAVKQKNEPKMNAKSSLNSFKTRNNENKLPNVSKLNPKNPVKSEQKNSKQINRKVIPLTTKIVSNKAKNKEIIISRNTPTINSTITDDENEIFDYLEYVCGSIPIDSNSNVLRDQTKSLQNSSFDDKLNHKDINELQTLLKKIELKKNGIQEKLEENNCWTDVSEDEKKSKQTKKLTKKVNKKKKVRWSQNTSHKSTDNSDVEDLNEPKFGAYSSLLKQQISQLENRVLDLKSQSLKREKVANESHNKTADHVLSPISDEVIKLKSLIETLNKRLTNIESKSYDLISSQKNGILNSKQNIKSKSNYFERNTIKSNSTFNGQNILVKESPNDRTIDLPNGDKMQISKDNTVFYTFTNGATQTTYSDGLKIINFPNGQIERLHKNGVKHITYSNGLQRIINPDSSEEVVLGDGTVWRIHSDGTESLEFSNGDREIRTDEYKRREYRNGNIKTLYSDGTEETRYVSGRLRIKDRFGNLIVDSVIKHLNEHNI